MGMAVDGRDCSLSSVLRQGLILVGVRTRTQMHRQGHRIERHHPTHPWMRNASARGAVPHGLAMLWACARQARGFEHGRSMGRRKELPPRLYVTLVQPMRGSFPGAAAMPRARTRG